MNPPWSVNKTNFFISCVGKGKISSEVIEGLERVVATITLTPTKNFRLFFRSPKNIFQIWNGKLADSDCRKGKRSGFRFVCFFITEENVVFLDMIERRVDLGGKKEHPRAQQAYTKYLDDLKRFLLKQYGG